MFICVTSVARLLFGASAAKSLAIILGAILPTSPLYERERTLRMLLLRHISSIRRCTVLWFMTNPGYTASLLPDDSRSGLYAHGK